MKEYIEKSELISKLQSHHDFFIKAYGGFKNLPKRYKARVDEITNCISEVVNTPAADVVERKRGEWVSVEERLPDIELVEAKANDMEYFPCLAVIKSTVSVLGRYVSKLWYGEEGFIDQDVCPMDNVVTHWMPLPELPNCGADMRRTEVER